MDGLHTIQPTGGDPLAGRSQNLIPMLRRNTVPLGIAVGLVSLYYLSSVPNWPDWRSGTSEKLVCDPLELDEMREYYGHHWNPHKGCVSENHCSCQDPLRGAVPPERYSNTRWRAAYTINLNTVYNQTEDIDLVMFGDALVERWTGRVRGAESIKYQPNLHVFQSLFDKKHNASLQGMALGIGGDMLPHQLYRMQHGELSQNWTAKVYWLAVRTSLALSCSH